MARQQVKNTFLKGMNKDRAWGKTDPQQYRDASNIRLLTDDMGDSMGSVSTVRGNLLDFVLPDTTEVYSLIETGGLAASLDGSLRTFVLTINSITSTITYSGTEIDLFYASVSDQINKLVAQNVYSAGLVAQSNDSGIALYSSLHQPITGVTTSLWSVGGSVSLNASISVPLATDLRIIGQCRLRELAILFTVPLNGNSGQIWKVEWDNQNVSTITLVRNGNDNFSLSNDIEALGRYELPLVQRIYWTDDNNSLRSLNIFSETSFLDRIDINPKVKFDIPIVQSLSQSGGSLATGWYTYGYRYKNLGGSKTNFSPFSQPFPIMVKNEESESYESFEGNASGVATSKELIVKIENVDVNFNFMDIVVGYMADLNSSPVFSFVEEEFQLSGSSSLTFTHSNASALTISQADISIPDTIFTRCKTITIKDNRLLAGNLKDDVVNIDQYDANSFRYTYNTNTADYSTATSDKRNPLNKDSTAYNTWKSDDDQNAFMKGTRTLGGSGAEIDFKFVNHHIILDSTLYSFPAGTDPRVEVRSNAPDTSLNGKTIPMGNSKIWNSFKSPFVSSHFRGYARSEVYRFGIVFFDKSGRSLDVKWIADIRMPEASQMPVFSVNGSNLEGHALGLEFSVNIPGYIKTTCSGFSIVRAERTDSDRSIRGQGMMFDVGVHNIKRTDLDDSLVAHSYRVDRHTCYGVSTNDSAAEVFPLMEELHTLSVPELLISDQKLNLTPYEIRPIVGLNNSGTGMSGNTNVDNQPTGSGQHNFAFGKYYTTDAGSGTPTRYFSSDSAINNYDALKIDIDDSEFLQGMEGAWPFRGQLLIGAPWSNFYVTAPGGFMNYAAPRFDSDAIGEREWTSGSNQIQYRGRGGFAHFVNVPSGQWKNTMCTQPLDVASSATPQAASRILKSSDFNFGSKNRIEVNGVNTTGGEANTKMLFNLYSELSNQYGGDKVSDIENTIYISTGHYQAIDNSTPSTVTATVYGGDTYINIYDEVQTYANENSAGTTFDDFYFKETNSGGGEFKAQGFGIMYPVESSINLDWRQGMHLNNVGTASGFSNVNFINFSDNIDSLRSPLGITEDWERRQSDAFSFFSLSSFSLTTNEWDNRVWTSDNKINGEASDSWRSFKVNNYWDVDGNLGPINKLVTFNDTVMYFQDRAFGKLIVNPNPMLVGSDGVTLALGKGGTVLQDNAYISTSIGTKHQWSVFTSPRSVYWFDIVNKKPYQYSSSGAGELSDIKGMHSFFVDNVDNNLLNTEDKILGLPNVFNGDNPANRLGIRGVYDELNNEALFTFLTPKTTYPETAAGFSQYSSTIPGGIMPERSLVTILENKTVLDDSGAVIATISKPASYDVIKAYPIGTNTLVPASIRTPEYLKARPTYKGKDFTLCYSEITSAWSAFFDFTPTIYIDTKARLITPNPDYPSRFHLHNVGDYNKWYGDDFKTHLEVVTNIGPEMTKVYDNVSWHTVSQSKSGALGKKLDQLTFDVYYAYNDYQHTGDQSLDLSIPKPLIRRVEREWQMAIPRNVVDPAAGADVDVLDPTNWLLNRPFSDRIRDKYLIQHFEYDNSSTDKFTINYVNTLVRLSNR